MTEDLQRFVRHARERGMDLASIRILLSSAGWKDKQIGEAFCSGELDLEVPTPATTGTARDVFFHLLAFTAFYTWTVSLVLLLFAYVDIAFVDPAWAESDRFREMRSSGIRAGLAALVVAYPVFVVLWRHLLRDIRRHPQKARSAVRRWLTFLSLFVGAVAMAVDVITLVYFLFEGQLSVRFLLKVVVLFAIAGLGVTYLAMSLRSEPKESP